MPQTNDFFVKNPVLNLECKVGESTNLKAIFHKGKNVGQIVGAVSANGCSCVNNIVPLKDGISFTYTNQLKKEDFEKQGGPLFLYETRYMTIYYKKEGVENKIRTETGALVFNPELLWESVIINAKTTL